MSAWDGLEDVRSGIFAGESGGDYGALFGFANRPGGKFAGVNLTDMTIDDAIAFSDPGGPYAQHVKGQIGRVATPMGGYQVVGSTLRLAKQALGLTGKERFDQATQDRIGRWIYDNQGTGAWEGYRGPKAGGGNPDATPGPRAAPPAQPSPNALAAYQAQMQQPQQNALAALPRYDFSGPEFYKMSALGRAT